MRFDNYLLAELRNKNYEIKIIKLSLKRHLTGKMEHTNSRYTVFRITNHLQKTSGNLLYVLTHEFIRAFNG